MLELREVCFKYGHLFALNDFSFRFPDKGVVGLFGENGAGKSTLLDIMSGFIPVQTGRIYELATGTAVSSRWLIHHSVRLHQALVLPEQLGVSDYLGLAQHPEQARWLVGGSSAAEVRLDRDQIEKTGICRILSSVGINVTGNLQCSNLSWGQRRSVALSAALLAPKDFLLLDEPFEGFSPNTIDVVRDVLKEMAQEKLILIAEHALDVMIGMADIALVFKNGKLVRSFDSPEIRYSEVMAYFG